MQDANSADPRLQGLGFVVVWWGAPQCHCSVKVDKQRDDVVLWCNSDVLCCAGWTHTVWTLAALAFKTPWRTTAARFTHCPAAFDILWRDTWHVVGPQGCDWCPKWLRSRAKKCPNSAPAMAWWHRFGCQVLCAPWQVAYKQLRSVEKWNPISFLKHYMTIVS